MSSDTSTVGMSAAAQTNASMLAVINFQESNLLERAKSIQSQLNKTPSEPRSRKHELIQEEDGRHRRKHRRVLEPSDENTTNDSDRSEDSAADEKPARRPVKHNGVKAHPKSRPGVNIGIGSGSRNPNSILGSISKSSSTAGGHASNTTNLLESEHEPEDVHGIFNEMVDELATLREQNRNLRAVAKALHQRLYPPEIPPRSQIVHEVSCDCRQPTRVSLFADQPQFNTFRDSSHIEGRSLVNELNESDLSRRAVILLVRKKYACNRSAHRRQWLRKHGHLLPGQEGYNLAPLCGESAAITSESVCRMLGSVFSSATSEPWSFTPDSQIQAPYMFYYHNREAIQHFASSLDSDSRRFVDVIIAYFESFSPEFSRADTLFRNGQVHRDVLSYLFEPNQVIVQQHTDQISAYLTLTYPTTYGIVSGSCNVAAFHYGYDGKFFYEAKDFHIACPDTPEPVPITQLPYYPLKYAEEGVQTRLRERGKQFWKCRGGRYVQYHDPDSLEVQLNDFRFMIDYGAMPPGQTEPRPVEDYLNEDSVTDLDLDQDNMSLLFPSVIKAYNMVEKRWEELKMSGVTDVVWNKRAFDSLVAEPETKEFVQALVTNQLAANKSTDLISGKGSSLVILLHGSPGTGKTLTAESVAELAERPLYRVTCGDIGTDAAGVEVKLQQVLGLGKKWGCVVLLDEADLFLEERSLQDLGRNALVSVFLRALEYYEGILILTTNRVGTFDEAFKSRIQLSLRYHPLVEEQRLLIWENFFKRLEQIDEEGIDLSSLRQHVRELARHKMNGREIRNSLTNARQLAKYKGAIMDIQHLRRAVRVFNKFEEYTKDIKHGIPDETIARERGER